ncbi:hypothetical protein [Jiella avicenniae]|uniref:Uncharacterized protein n=1 Tax=Jiella avicenniae TaxID=2907202 RepID=A0A9X1P0P7_9HYPH|nr:hypothetical protein [Jiella avicenniae]MCE7028937.1 hypothetical protein [Jiella avicenniae]
MARSPRIDPFARAFELMVDEIASPAARAQRLAETAQAEIDRAKEINRRAFGADAKHEITVDGRRGAPVQSVRPGGIVFAEWHFMREVLVYIGEQLLQASPVLTGRYSRSHILLVDGVEHLTTDDLPEDAGEYVFLNTQPYSRKIEGAGGRPPLSDQAPDGVFEVIAGMAHHRFGNIADIRFGWRALADAPGQSTASKRKAERASRTPAIIVRAY